MRTRTKKKPKFSLSITNTPRKCGHVSISKIGDDAEKNDVFPTVRWHKYILHAYAYNEYILK